MTPYEKYRQAEHGVFRQLEKLATAVAENLGKGNDHIIRHALERVDEADAERWAAYRDYYASKDAT